MVSGRVWDGWQEAFVAPIFTQEVKINEEKYQSDSLTSQLCKIIDNVIRDEILNHVESSNLINDTHHGFHKSRSCLAILLAFIERIC